MVNKIDFVIAWVDGSDPVWQAEKEKYTGIKAEVDACRYRDMDLLRYWFRGVEKFAPWVNKIHFVTCGHLPEWLNVKHPKLNVVKHEDYIPEKYLPTFNSHTIELNFHRIKGLSEQFVYFNDDIFLLGDVTPEDFFKDGKARDTMALETLRFDSRSIAFIDANNIALINDVFNKKEFVKKNFLELLNPSLGYKKIVKNLLLMPFPYFTGFYNHHLASSMLKKSYEFAWLHYDETLDHTCSCKVRERKNVNQWLIKDIQFVKGVVKNRSKDFGARINLREKNVAICGRWIKEQRFKMLCINDNEFTSNFDDLTTVLNKAFEDILNTKSLFEN